MSRLTTVSTSNARSGNLSSYCLSPGALLSILNDRLKNKKRLIAVEIDDSELQSEKNICGDGEPELSVFDSAYTTEIRSIDIQAMKFTAGLLRLCRPMCGKSRTCRRMRRKDLGLRPRCRGTAPICWSGNKRKATGPI